MIRSTLAIAGLAVRSALRSKLVLCLAVALAAGLVAMPPMVQGDGTLIGRIKVTLTYSMGYAAVVLALAILWAACRLIADDIAGHQIHHVVVKPIHRVQIWIGKWLGLLVLSAVLLAGAGAFIYGSVLWMMRFDSAPAAEKAEIRDTVLTARTRLAPRETLSDDRVHEVLDQLVAQGHIPADAPHDEAFMRVKRSLQRGLSTVDPGESYRWVFDVPSTWVRRIAANDITPVTLQFHLSQHAFDRQPVTGQWHIGTPPHPQLVTLPVHDLMERTHRLVVPLTSAMIEEGVLHVTFANSDSAGTHRAVFQLEGNVELLLRQGGFGGNVLKALLILFAKIALLAALGLWFSAMFSFPVAAFSSFSTLVVVLLVHYLAVMGGGSEGCGHDHGNDQGEHGSVWLVHAGEGLGRGLAVVIEPVMGIKALAPLADGMRIDGGSAVRAVVLMLWLYPGLLGAAAGKVLNARELGLPARSG